MTKRSFSLTGGNKSMGRISPIRSRRAVIALHDIGPATTETRRTLNGYSIDTDLGDSGAGFDQPSPLQGITRSAG